MTAPTLAAGGLDPQARRYVEFRDGHSLLAAIVDENVYPIVQRVAYQGLEQPAALAFSASHPLLRDGERARLFTRLLATHGGAPQVVMPRLPEAAWIDPVDAVLAVPLEPAASTSPSGECLLLLRDPATLRAARDLLLAFAIPFRLGLFALPGIGDVLCLIADLERAGGPFIVDMLREQRDTTLMYCAWRQATPAVALYVEAGYRHPCATVLQRLTARLADWEHLLCARDCRLRAIVRPESMLSYVDAVPTLLPQELTRPVTVAVKESRSVLSRLADQEIDRVEVRIERSVGLGRGARGAAALDAEAAMLRLELLSLSERLHELDRRSGRVPVIYGYHGQDVQPLRSLFRSLPHSIKERLLGVALENRRDGSPWFFLLAQSAADVVRLPVGSAEWTRFIGQTDASESVPVVYLPEGYQLSPSLAAIGARRFARVLTGSAAELAGGRRLLLPDGTAGGWRQLVLPLDACRPLLHGLSTLAQGQWETLFAAPSLVPPAPTDRWAGAFDEYERDLVTQVAARLEKLEERIRELLPRAGQLVDELTKRTTMLEELEGFNDKLAALWESDVAAGLSRLEEMIVAFSRQHGQLAERLRAARAGCAEVERLAAEVALGAPAGRRQSTAGSPESPAAQVTDAR